MAAYGTYPGTDPDPSPADRAALAALASAPRPAAKDLTAVELKAAFTAPRAESAPPTTPASPARAPKTDTEESK